MDELGSALRHSDEPNFMVAPFLYMPEGNLASAVRSATTISSSTLPFLALFCWTTLSSIHECNV